MDYPRQIKDTHNYVDESRRHLPKWEKPDAKTTYHVTPFTWCSGKGKTVGIKIGPVAARVWERERGGTQTGSTRQSGGDGILCILIAVIGTWLCASVQIRERIHCRSSLYVNKPKRDAPACAPKWQHVLPRMECKWSSHTAGGSANGYHHCGKLFGSICEN